MTLTFENEQDFDLGFDPEDDEREADALCKRYLERWREELE